MASTRDILRDWFRRWRRQPEVQLPTLALPLEALWGLFRFRSIPRGATTTGA